MKVRCNTVILVVIQQIFVCNAQLGASPFLQWLVPVANQPQQPQQPQTPANLFNPLNFLQLIRPAPSSPLSPLSPVTPTTSYNQQTQGIIPAFMQQLLQNVRPVGGQNSAGGTPSILGFIPTSSLFGGLQNVNRPSFGNAGGLAAIPQQLLGNALGNYPFLGLQQLGANQIGVVGVASPTVGNNPISITSNPLTTGTIPTNIAGFQTLNPTDHPTIDMNNIAPLPAPHNSDKPVTEISNEVDSKPNAPYVSLGPSKPLDPSDPTLISYTPYTTTVKPYTHRPDADDSVGPQTFTRPDEEQQSPHVDIKVTTELPDTFVPIFFEKKGESPSASTRSEPLIADTTRSEVTRPIITKTSPLSSKFITSMMPTSPIVTTNQVVSSPMMLVVPENKKPEEEMKQTVTKPIKSSKMGDKETSHSIPATITTIPPKKDITEQSSKASSNRNTKTPSVGATPLSDMIPEANHQVPNDFVQGDELPNDFFPNPEQYDLGQTYNYAAPNPAFGSDDPGLGHDGPGQTYNFMSPQSEPNGPIPSELQNQNLNYAVNYPHADDFTFYIPYPGYSHLPSVNPQFIVNEGVPGGVPHPPSLYADIPHFALQRPYSSYYNQYYQPLEFASAPPPPGPPPGPPAALLQYRNWHQLPYYDQPIPYGFPWNK